MRRTEKSHAVNIPSFRLVLSSILESSTLVTSHADIDITTSDYPFFGMKYQLTYMLRTCRDVLIVLIPRWSCHVSCSARCEMFGCIIICLWYYQHSLLNSSEFSRYRFPNINLPSSRCWIGNSHLINHDMVHHHPSSHNQLLVTDLNFTGAAHVSYISCVCLPVLYGTRLAQGEYRCSTQCSARRLLIIQQNQRTVEGLNIGMKPMMTQHILGECYRVGHYSLYIQSLVRR